MVNIRGNTPGQIKPVALEVFQQQGYQVARATPNQLEFDKPATRWDNLAYGNWVDSPLWLRVKVDLVPSAAPGCRLECRVYLVRDKGNATEEELPLRHAKRTPYQELLDKIAARFS